MLKSRKLKNVCTDAEFKAYVGRKKIFGSWDESTDHITIRMHYGAKIVWCKSTCSVSLEGKDWRRVWEKICEDTKVVALF